MTTRFVEISTPDELAKVEATRGLPRLAEERLIAEAPDTHWILLDGDTILACCTLWWTRVPPYGHQRVGVLGHFAAQDAPSALCILKHGASQLAAKGCTIAVGPMDGNTWRRYRFITERGSEPPFFLEPDNPDDYPRFFAGAGFSPLASYTSALNTALGHLDERSTSLSKQIVDHGVSIRHANASRMEDELHDIYQMSLASFQHNFLYTPIEEAEFMAQYSKILPHVRPELILIAEREGQPVGFLFAIPDVLRANRQRQNDTIIIKTIAVVPQCAGIGLGSYLVMRGEKLAYDLGFRRAIHALMHESNRSQNISDHSAVTMRRYALFSMPILP
jgi:GNAT superfamily N-acetyltransferase